MGEFNRRTGAVILLFIFLALLAAPGFSEETTTAYTRDGIHYISKERVDENIRFEYAKPGDYRAVQVPLNAIIVGGSTIPKNVSQLEGKNETAINSLPKSNQTEYVSQNKYPYASFFIGLLVIGGLVLFVASFFSGRDRQ